MAETKKKNYYYKPKLKHKAEEIWLISYADLITLLLVFFALMIASSSTVSGVKMEKIKKALKGEPPPPTEKTIEDIKEEIEQRVQQGNMADAVEVIEDDHSLAVILKEQFLFELGKAEIKQENRAIMSDFIKIFRGLPDYARIAIEGYTDDNPIKSPVFRNNWHLSVIRALTILEEFDREGVCKQNCELRGFGEFRPLKPNRDDSGKVIERNQSENRRVVIRVF